MHFFRQAHNDDFPRRLPDRHRPDGIPPVSQSENTITAEAKPAKSSTVVFYVSRTRLPWPRGRNRHQTMDAKRTMVAIGNYQSGFPRRSRPGATTNFFGHRCRERLREISDANRRRQQTQCAITSR